MTIGAVVDDARLERLAIDLEIVADLQIVFGSLVEEAETLERTTQQVDDESLASRHVDA